MKKKRKKNELKKYKTIWNLLKEDKKNLIISSILLVLASLATLPTGFLNGAATESITKYELKNAFIYLIIYLLIEVLMEGVLYSSASSMLQKVESRLTRKLGFNTYIKALNLPAKAYEKLSSGEVINRITTDADSLSFVFGRLLDTFTHIAGSFLLLFYIFYISPIIGLEIVIVVGILILVISKFNPILIRNHKERRKEQDKFASLTNESIRGIRELKTLGIKNNLITDMRDLIKDILKTSIKEIDTRRRYEIITRFIRVILEVGCFITCIILLYYRKINLTFFIAMTYYIYRYMYLMDSINVLTTDYQRVSVAVGRVNELLENELYQDEKFGDKEIDSKGIIEFKNVTFGYPREKNILENFNLKLEPNKKIAIVGKSGQGKSTLFNLLTRVFDPKKGTITLDGVNIKDLSEDSLRKNISVIRQEPFVFNRTIKENFKLIDPKIKLEEIRKYTALAYLDDYIMSLPKGYDTLLGEGGVNLSGGQKQRLAIARTLIKKSKVILFDEATSALDNNSQEYIKETIDNLVKDHTVVIVAHRLSTIIDSDIIYIVDDGKIVGSGTHQELLKKNKIYKNLYKTESLNS